MTPSDWGPALFLSTGFYIITFYNSLCYVENIVIFLHMGYIRACVCVHVHTRALHNYIMTISILCCVNIHKQATE
jgi:hypothetical protein